MKKLFIVFVAVFTYSSTFGQTSSADKNQSGGTSSSVPGVSFTLPAGPSWRPIPEKQSFVPYIENKVLEQIDPQSKVSVVFQAVGSYADVPSLFDQSTTIFSLHWGDLTLVQPIRLVSPKDVVGGPRKFSALYRIVDKVTSTPFRLEVVVASPYDMRGNKGVLFILCPEYAYYDSRFIIENLRNALTVDENAASSQAVKPAPTK